MKVPRAVGNDPIWKWRTISKWNCFELMLIFGSLCWNKRKNCIQVIWNDMWFWFLGWNKWNVFEMKILKMVCWIYMYLWKDYELKEKHVSHIFVNLLIHKTMSIVPYWVMSSPLSYVDISGTPNQRDERQE